MWTSIVSLVKAATDAAPPTVPKTTEASYCARENPCNYFEASTYADKIDGAVQATSSGGDRGVAALLERRFYVTPNVDMISNKDFCTIAYPIPARGENIVAGCAFAVNAMCFGRSFTFYGVRLAFEVRCDR